MRVQHFNLIDFIYVNKVNSTNLSQIDFQTSEEAQNPFWGNDPEDGDKLFD